MADVSVLSVWSVRLTEYQADKWTSEALKLNLELPLLSHASYFADKIVSISESVAAVADVVVSAVLDISILLFHYQSATLAS